MLKKWGTVTVFLGLLMPTAVLSIPEAAAEEMFVRPSVEVPVRRGQGTDYKIIKLVKDGDLVELLERDESWARVRVDGGAEGWMPERFLSSEAPPVKRLQRFQTENEQLQLQKSELDRELAELKGLQANSDSELSACIMERDTVHAQYQTLEAETSDVLAIKGKLAVAETEVQETRATLASVQQQNERLRQKTALYWFLAGGGVLIAGWIIGMITGRARRKRPSLL